MASGSAIGKGALLLCDSWGEREASWLKKKKEQHFLKGTLLLAIPEKQTVLRNDGKPSHNYCVYKSDDVTLYCPEEDVSPLTNHEFKLLSGMKTSGARYQAFIDGILEWGAKLKVNDVVYVALPSKQPLPNPTRCQAEIRWMGILPGEEGVKFGLEITEEKYVKSGYNNGYFQGQQLFVCSDNGGMFESLDKLAPTANHSTQMLQNPQLTARTKKPNEPVFQSSPAARPPLTPAADKSGPVTRSQANQGLSDNLPPSRFKIGDRVVAYNKDQHAIHGTVKWIGSSYKDTVKVNAVGIETDVSVKSKDFLIAFIGLSSMFKCDNSSHGKVVVPEGLVLTEFEAMEAKQQNLAAPSHHHANLHRRNPQGVEKVVEPPPTEQIGSASRSNLPSSSQLQRHSSHDHTQRNTPGNCSSTVPSGKKSHTYDSIPGEKLAGSLGHHSNSTGNLPELKSQANNAAPSQFEEEAMLREANIETKAFNRAEQERMLMEFNQKRDKERRIDSGGPRNPLGSSTPHRGDGSSVDPPENSHSSSSNAYQNVQDKAFAPAPEGAVDHHFTMNSRVQFSHPPRYGVIRWMGNLPQVTGLIAGVELEGDMEGCTDGAWQGTRYFACKFGRGFFCPVTTLHPDQREFAPSQQASNTPSAYRGPAAQPQSSTPPAPTYREQQRMPQPQEGGIPLDASMGSTIQVGNPPRYGVLRWIGTFPGSDKFLAGIELEESAENCGNGFFEGVQYFKCDYGHAYFCPLNQVQPDQRFANLGSTAGGHAATSDNPVQVPFEEKNDQTSIPPFTKYLGEQKGIQGHQNSCYLDSTLFGLFALSDIFDSLFLQEAAKQTNDKNRKEISDILWKWIVNPLRKNGVVRFESVMMMRNKLEELGKMEGITEKEKDPEEFLNMLFKRMLRVPAFISIRRPFGVEQEFFVQLFVEHDPNLKVPTVEELLKKMFKEQNISFTEVPSKLLIQVPRFGREFKTYNKVIPDLKLRILELTDSYTQVPDCMFCGERSSLHCDDCAHSGDFQSIDGSVYFCSRCSLIAHGKKERKYHALQDAVDMDVSELDLLSVICIETSHYVCFTKDPNSDSWIFFDSMANRVYDTYNIPKVTDCTRELNDWVYSGDRTRLMSTQPRQLPELVRRFTQDIYMCVYIQPDLDMYGAGSVSII